MSGQPGGWQPISTAPDGEVVFVSADVATPEERGAVAIYCDGRWENAVTAGLLDFEPDGWRPLGGGS